MTSQNALLLKSSEQFVNSPEFLPPEAVCQDAVLEPHQIDQLNTSIPSSEISHALVRLNCKRIALHGPSGTGKTTLARWLAAQLGRPLLIVRTADLLPTAGAQRIAAMTSQACHQGAVLLLEDADFLLHRGRPGREIWEVALAHEVESALGKYQGVAIASSSLCEVPDPGSLRQFEMNIRVDYLREEDAWTLFMDAAASLNIEDLLTVAPRELARLYLLAPADFASVVRQARFRPVKSLRELYVRLYAEFSLKLRPWERLGALRSQARGMA
ncbi:AAA family ATPase [Achromobacter xylosoxidans]|uniref:AAA family ATPase n=1 Tax=Alcaligenes xylosoxydans xylosoxydans TaxID=85698 RepID=UPI003209B3FF